MYSVFCSVIVYTMDVCIETISLHCMLFFDSRIHIFIVINRCVYTHLLGDVKSLCGERVCLFFIASSWEGQHSLQFCSKRGVGPRDFLKENCFKILWLLCWEKGSNTILKHVFILEAWIVGYCSMNYCSIVTLVLSCS